MLIICNHIINKAVLTYHTILVYLFSHTISDYCVIGLNVFGVSLFHTDIIHEYQSWKLVYSVIIMCSSLLYIYSVEGQGNDATINDVTYYTSTKNKNEDDTEDAYRSILEKIKEKERELSRLDFHRQTLDRQVVMLKMFSRNATSAPEDKKTVLYFYSIIIH